MSQTFKTGIYVRIQRGGRWENLDVCDLTDEELAAWASKMSTEESHKWVRGLVKWIREHVQFEVTS